ncbi:HAD family hydrolase [bacterium]|nr:HAD family hydrolase [bacterium]
MPRASVVTLLDIDNTLLDNDAVTADLRAHLTAEVGRQRQARYWQIFEELRGELGYADYLGALQRYRLEQPQDSHLLALSMFLIDYPFANRLYPGSLDVIAHVKRWGPAVVLSDGDVVFQPRKIHRAGIFEAVDGNILVYIHKEQELADVARRYPAKHYIMVDDKPRLLDAVKRSWGERVTTVFPRQGHYALDPDAFARCAIPDVTLQRIGELVDYDLQTLLAAARPAPRPPRRRR